jgi:hypothetical protein
LRESPGEFLAEVNICRTPERSHLPWFRTGRLGSRRTLAGFPPACS